FPYFHWPAFPQLSRPLSLDEAAIENMRVSGCYKLFIGIESATERVLRAMNKQQDLDQIARRVSICRQYGIKVQGLFMLGYPGETPEEMSATVRFAIDLGLDDAMFNAVRAYPDTQLYEECLAAGADETALLEYRELMPQVSEDDLTPAQRRAKDALESSGIFNIRSAMKFNLVNGVQIGTMSGEELGRAIVDAYVAFYYREEFVERALRQRALTAVPKYVEGLE
ncbi:MAG: B12-binding domain-containing radical SAM protein, partial [Syntrophales bacterium]